MSYLLGTIINAFENLTKRSLANALLLCENKLRIDFLLNKKASLRLNYD